LYLWGIVILLYNLKLKKVAILFKSFLFRPWVDQRDSGRRITSLDHPGTFKREFVINPYFITDLKTHAKGSTFAYSDNIGDRREKWSTVICDKSVAQIQAYLETTPFSHTVTLPIHKNNNPENETVDTTIMWSTISYVDRYNPDPENHVWIVYDKGSFKRVEVLCNLALEDVLDLVRYGSTSTTFSTVPDVI
jgi:hypothetical protein